MKKVTRDGETAVAYSSSCGSGWSTWNEDKEELIFHPKIIQMIEEERQNEITEEWVKDNIGIEAYCGGASNLKIAWVPVGTSFLIKEYDGFEEVVAEPIKYFTA